MRNPDRIKRILSKIQNLWEVFPDQRFFQLLFNYTQLGSRKNGGGIHDPFYYEDDELESILDNILLQINGKKK